MNVNLTEAAIRDALDWADRYQSTSDGAARARDIMLDSESPKKIRYRKFGFWRERADTRDITFDDLEIRAIYEAA